MKIIKNYLYNFSYQIFLMIVPLVTMPYVARVMGPNALGINSYTYSISYYFILLGVVGLTTYGQREVAYVRDNDTKLRKVFWEIEILSLLTTGVSFALFAVYILTFGEYQVYLWAYSIVIVANVLDISWLLTGLEKFGILSLRNLLIKLVMLALIFSFVKTKEDLLIYILINSIGTLVSNISLWPYVHKIGLPTQIKKLRPLVHLKPALFLFIPQLSISLYTVLNKVMLGLLSSIDEVAYFDSSDKIVRLSFSVLISLSTVLMPVAAHAVSSGNSKGLKNILKYSLSFSMMIAFPMMFGIIALADNLVPLFLGKQYVAVVPVLILQSIMIMPMSIANVIGNQYLVPTNKIRIFNFTIILGSITNLILNIPMIFFFGALGAAFSVAISETIVAFSQLMQVRKILNIAELFEEWYKYLFAAAAMFIVLIILHFFTTGWLGILTSFLVGIFVYFTVLHVLSPKFYKLMLTKVKRNDS